MAFNYENDVKRLGGNLQTTVAYLLSLHKNEYEWNLLGIKVVGHVDALPIPDGTYEYGDAYTVGTAAPYDMWIYTRADEFHSEAYWFNIGKFPAPGPQGPKGDGWETAQLFQEGITTNLTYDSTNGGKNESISSMTYVDSTTGHRLTKNFQMVSRLPIIPGKYVSIDATEDNKKIKVKVDENALGLDFYKITKGDTANVPAYSPTNGVFALPYSYHDKGSSLVRRGIAGEAKFSYGIFGSWHDINTNNVLEFSQINKQVGYGKGIIEITTQTSDEGSISILDLHSLKTCPQLIIVYRGKAYYRMDPIMPSSNTGIINFVHLDTVQDGSEGYKTTGKCFNLNLGSRAWKVFDLDFGGKVYQHAICFEVTGAGTSSTAQLWYIELIITTSSPNQITKNTLYKYISTSDYPLHGGTPISVYRMRVQGPQGMGVGRIAVHHEVGEISNTDHYIFELMSMDGISETITGKDQNGLDSFVDKVTEV